jgi:hypothetical protein
VTKTKRLPSIRCQLAGLIWLIAAILLLAGSALAGPKCDYCGKPIQGDYLTYDGRVYHPACYHQNIAPRCAVCGEEIVEGGIIFEEKNYHKTCFEDKVALRCSVCGGIIEGEYLVDHWGNKYHKYHQQEIASCSFCGRLFSDPKAGGGIDLDPPHKICHSCSETAVSDLKTAQPYVDQTLDMLTKAGITVKPKDFKLKLVTREELGRITGQELPDQFGLTHYQKTEYWGFLEDKELMIYIVAGLPKMHFISTVAHELMHAWLFLNPRYDPDEGDPQLIEGSCNGAALLVLRQFDDEMAAYVIRQMEEEESPIYGDGFRRVEHMIDNRGVDYWLQHVRLDPEFPIGY